MTISRRALLVGSTAAAGGLRPGRPDQHYEPPAGGQAIPGARAVVRAREVIVVGGTPPTSGVYVYNPTIALGNLIASIAAAAGTDSKGNAVLPGIVSYFGPFGAGIWLAIQTYNGGLNFFSAPTEAGPWTQLGNIGDDPGTGLGLTTINGDPITIGGVASGPITLSAAVTAALGLAVTGDVTITGDNSAAALLVTAGSGVHAANLNGSSNSNVVRIQNSLSGATGALLLVEPAGVGDLAFRTDVIGDANARFNIDDTGLHRWGNGTAGVDTRLYRAAAGELAADSIAANNGGTAEVWNAPTFANSWANAGTGTALQYRLVAAPYNSMQWTGRITAPAGIVAGQAVITAIPAAYRPAHVQPVLGVDLTTGALVRFQMSNTGVLLYESGSAAGDNIDIQCGAALVSLDA